MLLIDFIDLVDAPMLNGEDIKNPAEGSACWHLRVCDLTDGWPNQTVGFVIHNGMSEGSELYSEVKFEIGFKDIERLGAFLQLVATHSSYSDLSTNKKECLQ